MGRRVPCARYLTGIADSFRKINFPAENNESMAIDNFTIPKEIELRK
jgi:hypothetical protein